MATQAISSTLASSTRPPKTTTKNFNNLNSEDFFGLLIAQLQNQDPLKPTDNQTLLNQISSIRQMEQSSTLTKTAAGLEGVGAKLADAVWIVRSRFGNVEPGVVQREGESVRSDHVIDQQRH